jgi:hypothetical protein
LKLFRYTYIPCNIFWELIDNNFPFPWIWPCMLCLIHTSIEMVRYSTCAQLFVYENTHKGNGKCKSNSDLFLSPHPHIDLLHTALLMVLGTSYRKHFHGTSQCSQTPSALDSTTPLRLLSPQSKTCFLSLIKMFFSFIVYVLAYDVNP